MLQVYGVQSEGTDVRVAILIEKEEVYSSLPEV
jgi:hypothetical protein